MGKMLTLGEIMLRLSTTVGERVASSNQFFAHYGGGEANVAISLANFGHTVAFASKIPENALGDGVKQHLQRYGVECRYLLRGGNRLGTYYVETGIGERAAQVVYDRKGSSFVEMTKSEWPTEMFEGIDIFHISGITPALSKNWQQTLIELVQAAKQAGAKISLDINFRGKLWTTDEAKQYLKQILPYVDFCSAGKLDAQVFMDIPAPDKETDDRYYYDQMNQLYPNIELFYGTHRKVISASHNILTGRLWHQGNYVVSQSHIIDPIIDRVGGGDAFAAGVLHGIANQSSDQELIAFATAASALKHTVHGDCNLFSATEINDFIKNGSGKIVR